jgi:hypothetical protein
MRKHTVLELEEIAWLGVGELVRLVDLGPDLVKICFQDFLDPLEVVAASVEVS